MYFNNGISGQNYTNWIIGVLSENFQSHCTTVIVPQTLVSSVVKQYT